MRYAIISLLMFGSGGVFGQSWSLGAAGIYGDDIDRAGVHVRGYYNLKNGKVCFGPEYSHFFKRSATINGEEVSIQLNEVNFNLHYIFELTETLGFYPLTGLNMSREKEEFEVGNHVEEHRVTEFGANLGFGMHKFAGSWIFFAEYDHLFSELSQNSFLIGAFFTFGKQAENKEHHE